MSSWPPPPPPSEGQPSQAEVRVDYTRAQSQVSPPAIVLTVYGVLGILGSLLSVAWNVLGPGIGALEGLFPNGADGRISLLFSGGIAVVSAFIGIVLNGVMIFGAMRMKALQSYAFAITAAIIAMLPCGCCCLIGLPIGIWALVVLFDANVKASFQG
jgi:hypothetical protein